MRAHLELNTQAIDLQTAEQKLMSRQVGEAGQAIAQLRMQQNRHQTLPSSDNDSITSDGDSVHQSHRGEHTRSGPISRYHMPKMSSPRFNGENPIVWKDKCLNYFKLMNVPLEHWVSVASLHFDDPASQWLQVYKKKHKNASWLEFALAVEHKFGKDGYRTVVTDLLELRQTGSVEEYYSAFQTLQFQVCMYNSECRGSRRRATAGWRSAPA